MNFEIMKIPSYILKIIFGSLIIISFAQNTQAQMVWENYRNEVYSYLSLMAQKGYIVFDDLIQPISRTKINQALAELNNEKDKLSEIEKKELAFYLEEYANDKNSNKVDFLKKDTNKRWRAFSAADKDFLINVDPIIQGGGVSGTNTNYTQRGIGMIVWGKIGKHFGFQFYGNDVTLNGNGADTTSIPDSNPGFVKQSDPGFIHNINYTEIRASMAYSWKNGSISFGQDYLTWGYGENGKMVLSDKSPAYPYIRLDYQPTKWLSFNYVHAWLNSNIVDSSRTYSYYNTAYGGKRVFYIPKFMATHSITVKPTKHFDLSLGESIIYSEQINVGYLMPLMFFKVYDNISSNGNILAGDNGQFFFQASARNWIKKTHLYATLFVDEIRITKIFTDSNRNQLGFNIGASVTDAFIPDLTLTGEYTRVNPFVYANLNPVQYYTNHSFNLGDWMGNNFDRLILSARYTPLARVKLYARYQYIRKGGAGTALQQYFLPEPNFLFDYQYSLKQLFLQCSYEWKHNLYLQGNANFSNQKNVSGTSITNNTISIGFNYGL